jgi:CheY-like chemotaxis protein
MVFGDEELAELRVQLIEAGHEPSNPRDARRAHGVAEGRSGARSSAPRRDEFLAILGHELRNPLAPVRQAVELLEAHASGQDPAYLRQARTVLARQVTHLTRLVDVLLDVKQSVHGRADASEGGADPASDPATAPASDPATAGPTSSTELAEADPGSPIGTVDLADADASVDLVRRVVELHGGRVTAHGVSPGRGSELRVWLPIAAAEDQFAEPGLPSSPAPAPVQGVAPRRVLVVDDNEDAAEMLALVLRKHGHAVELAFDGEDALVTAASSHPEVVLLDIGLPGIDGYEVARRLRSSGSAVRPVLVAVSGYGQPADREHSQEAGFDHHLVKPVAMEKLLPLIESPEQE